jgi:hypothetical protein
LAENWWVRRFFCPELKNKEEVGMETELTPLQKFDNFLKRTEPDGYNWTLEKVYQEAQVLGYDKIYVDKVIAGLRVYYHNNANHQRLKNRLHWARSIMKNLAPKTYGRQSARLTPSEFK